MVARESVLRVTYCWTEPSAYLAACIRELSARPGIEVTLLAWESVSSAPFDLGFFRGLNTRVLSASERNDEGFVSDVVADSRPDVIVFCGWAHRPYVRLLDAPRLRGVPFVLGADTTIRFDWRQRLAPLRIGSLLRRVDAVLVPGDRGALLMRSWGVPSRKVTRLLYGIDYDSFAAAGAERPKGDAWPNRFIFAGRYVHEKAIDVLIDAYRRYHADVQDPWPLTTCGTGPLASSLQTAEGIEDAGFLQPHQLAGFFGQAGVFVLPSRVEPWGQVIVEAAASGLPVICSDRCSAGPEVIKDFHSGLVVPSDDATALRDAMIWMHHHRERLPEMGRAAQIAASAYSAARWSDNQVAMFNRLLDGSN